MKKVILGQVEQNVMSITDIDPEKCYLFKLSGSSGNSISNYGMIVQTEYYSRLYTDRSFTKFHKGNGWMDDGDAIRLDELIRKKIEGRATVYEFDTFIDAMKFVLTLKP